MKNAKIAIIGSGISAAFFGYYFYKICKKANIQPDITFISLEYSGGACADVSLSSITHSYPSSAYMHLYGPHIFHTNDEDVWRLVNEVDEPFVPFNLHVSALMEGNIVPLPFSMETVKKCFSDRVRQRIEQELDRKFIYGSKITLDELYMTGTYAHFLADYIHNHMIDMYTSKQWGIDVYHIDRSVLDRVPFSYSNQTSYFLDRWQGLPKNGYSKLIKAAIEKSGAKTITNSSPVTIDLISKSNYDYVVVSSAIDEFFNYEYGELPYRTLEFTLYKDQVFHTNKEHVINYPNQYDYTRSVDYTNWYNVRSKNHFTVFEKPMQWTRDMTNTHSRYYPIANEQTAELYSKYKELADKSNKFIMIGRLGLYKYLNMDKAVRVSMDAATSLFNQLA